MNTMTTNINRVGNFTSSQIYKLMTNGRAAGSVGKPFDSYVQETNMERRLGRSLSDEATARPLSWGQLMEDRVFTLLSLDYRLCSDQTLLHPSLDFWAGSPDAEKIRPKKAAIDVKCPLTLKSFCALVDSFTSGGITSVRKDHKDGEKFYWQLVSNAIILGADHAELIVYCPYRKELDEIRELAGDTSESKFAWIHWAIDEELPFLIEGGYYQNLNVFEFEIPDKDKRELTERVVLAGDRLVDRYLLD